MSETQEIVYIAESDKQPVKKVGHKRTGRLYTSRLMPKHPMSDLKSQLSNGIIMLHLVEW